MLCPALRRGGATKNSMYRPRAATHPWSGRGAPHRTAQAAPRQTRFALSTRHTPRHTPRHTRTGPGPTATQRRAGINRNGVNLKDLGRAILLAPRQPGLGRASRLDRWALAKAPLARHLRLEVLQAPQGNLGSWSPQLSLHTCSIQHSHFEMTSKPANDTLITNCRVSRTRRSLKTRCLIKK